MIDEPSIAPESPPESPGPQVGFPLGVPPASRQLDDPPVSDRFKLGLAVVAAACAVAIVGILALAVWTGMTVARAIEAEVKSDQQLADVAPDVADDSGYAGDLARDPGEDPTGQPDDPILAEDGESRRQQIVWTGWTGAGRYQIVEYLDAGSQLKPTDVKIAVRDTTSGAESYINGYHVVAAEPYGAQLWLTRANDGVSSSPLADDYPALKDLPDDHGDAMHSLFTWTPRAPATPAPVATTASWIPQQGPGGVVALMQVDKSLGCWPARLSFKAADGRSVSVALPFDKQAYEPLGFSRSGDFFAVRDTRGNGLSRVVVVSTRSGAVVSDVGAPADADYSAAAWDTESDSLVVYGDASMAEEPNTFRAWKVRPNGKLERSAWQKSTTSWSVYEVRGAEVGRPVAFVFQNDDDETELPFTLSWAGPKPLKVDGYSSSIFSISPDGSVLSAEFYDDHGVRLQHMGKVGSSAVWDFDGGWINQ